jgi:glycosyltransferase involved in cell wall biosynthesis
VDGSESRRRILYIVTRAERGGAQAHVLQLLQASVTSYETILATGESGFLTEAAQLLGVRVLSLKHLHAPLSPFEDMRALTELCRAMKEIQPDIVHAHSSKAGILGRLAARFQGIPCVFTAHGWAFTDGAPLLRKCVALLSEWVVGRFGAATIAVSEYDRALSQRYGLGAGNGVETIRNGICDDQLRAHPEQGDPPVVTMVARFSAPKNHLALLRALSNVRAPYRLWLVGDGPLLGQAEQYAETLGVKNQATFYGDSERVSELLAKTHIFVLISRYEGLPISILEAMRAGLPIVATNVGGVPEAVREGWNGFLVDRDDEVALLDRLELLLQQPELRSLFGKNSRASFEKSFTNRTMISNTFAVYERMFARRHVDAADQGYIRGRRVPAALPLHAPRSSLR